MPREWKSRLRNSQTHPGASTFKKVAERRMQCCCKFKKMDARARFVLPLPLMGSTTKDITVTILAGSNYKSGCCGHAGFSHAISVNPFADVA